MVVLGAGALGLVITAHLARAGEDVTLLARGARADYLMQHGITITGLDDFNTPCSVVTNAKEISEADYLVLDVNQWAPGSEWMRTYQGAISLAGSSKTCRA